MDRITFSWGKCEPGKFIESIWFTCRCTLCKNNYVYVVCSSRVIVTFSPNFSVGVDNNFCPLLSGTHDLRFFFHYFCKYVTYVPVGESQLYSEALKKRIFKKTNLKRNAYNPCKLAPNPDVITIIFCNIFWEIWTCFEILAWKCTEGSNQ